MHWNLLDWERPQGSCTQTVERWGICHFYMLWSFLFQMLLLQSALPLSLFRLQLLYMSYCRPYFWELLTTSTPCRSNATPIMAKERMQNLPSPTFLASSSPFPSDIANIAVQPIFFCGSFRNSCFLYRISLKYNCALVRDDTFFF